MADSSSFVKNLVNLYESDRRDALAQLRQGAAGLEPLNLASQEAMGKFIPKSSSEREIKIYLMIASLYSIHPKHAEGKSYGRSLRELRESLSANAESFDERFARLLNTEFEDLHFQIRQFCSMLSSADIAIDYVRLLDDLVNWTHPQRVSQLTWARDYFAPLLVAGEAAKAP